MYNIKLETCWLFIKLGNVYVQNCLRVRDLDISLVYTFLSTRESCFLHQGPALNWNKLEWCCDNVYIEVFNLMEASNDVSLCVDFSLSSAHQTHDIRNVITLLPIHINLEHFLDHQWTTLNSAKFDSNLCQYNSSTNHHLLFWNVITHIVTVSTCLIITTTYNMAYKGIIKYAIYYFFLLTTLCSMI